MTKSVAYQKIATVMKPPALDEDWRIHAVCRQEGRDPDLWFEDNTVDELTAARLCNACPVRTGCLDRALTYREPFGVWGGLTPKQRREFESRKPRLGKTMV